MPRAVYESGNIFPDIALDNPLNRLERRGGMWGYSFPVSSGGLSDGLSSLASSSG